MSVPNSRDVGSVRRTRERWLSHQLDQLVSLSEGDENKGRNTNRQLFPEETCCFRTASGRMCSRKKVGGTHFCHQHLKMCHKYMQDYQKECGGTEEEKRKLFLAAKKLILFFYPSVEDAIRSIETAQEETPLGPRGERNSLSLNDFEGLVLPIQRSLAGMERKRRGQVVRQVKKNEEAWFSCWYGRLVYRVSCEACGQDEGHVAAYYIFKAAVLISKAVRDATRT